VDTSITFSGEYSGAVQEHEANRLHRIPGKIFHRLDKGFHRFSEFCTGIPQSEAIIHLRKDARIIL